MKLIERNLQNVTIRKYGTAFLEAFGMLPLTYFGARGDNLTDNYGNIQVAIDESIKRGLRYIFVPNGIYYYSGNLLNVEQIIFIGNSKYAKIYDGVNEIKIYQIGTQIPYEKGIETLDKEVTEEGYVDIEVKTQNASEAIIVIDNNVIHVVDELVMLNGGFIGNNKIYLTTIGDNNAYLSDVDLLENAIRIHYKITGTGGTLNAKVEWRVK